MILVSECAYNIENIILTVWLRQYYVILLLDLTINKAKLRISIDYTYIYLKDNNNYKIKFQKLD